MIISASYRTDIPAFYGKWFMERLRAGYCKIVRPYSRCMERVSLARKDVCGFVFWGRNLAPFRKHLREIKERGFPFVILYGINGYPRSLEPFVPKPEKSAGMLRELSNEHGPRVCVWRYDPIVITSLTPSDFHLRNFDTLASALAGSTDEVVISFLHPYKKTVRNMDKTASEAGFTWRDPTLEEKRTLASQLVEIARSHGLQLSVCAQREYIVPGAADAKCIDAVRLGDVAGEPIRASKSGHRKKCGCFASTDIGEYNTCPYGCAYCYAVDNHSAAKRRFSQHDPNSDFLFAPASDSAEHSVPASHDPLPLFEHLKNHEESTEHEH